MSSCRSAIWPGRAHAIADRPASSIQRLPVSGHSGSAGMESPQPKDAPQLLPARRVTGISHRLLVLHQEGPALVCGQLIQNLLRVELLLALSRLGAHHVIVTCRRWQGARHAERASAGVQRS